MPAPVTPAFLSYLNCVTNHSLKNLLNLFRRLSSRSPPPDFPPFRHRAVPSSFSTEPPIPFPFPLAPPSHYITIMSRSAACACPAVIVGATRVSPLFFSHIFFKSILFLSSNFFPRLTFFWLLLSFSPLCCLLPARAVARSLHARAASTRPAAAPVDGRARALASRRPRHASAAAAAATRYAAACLLPVHAKPACGPLLRRPISVLSPRPISSRLVPEHPGRH
jgi:hypothetical protein